MKLSNKPTHDRDLSSASAEDKAEHFTNVAVWEIELKQFVKRKENTSKIRMLCMTYSTANVTRKPRKS